MSMQEPRDPRMLRVSHADRDRVVEILRDAAGDGRLDAEELDERVERALQARTFAELEPLTQDLPVPQPAPPLVPATPAPAAVAMAVPAAAGGEVEAVTWSQHGHSMRREGVWAVPRLVRLDLHGGSARLDYTMARLPEGGASEIHVSLHGGTVRFVVPPGIAVDTSRVTRRGGSVRDHSARRLDPSTPITHVITVTGSTHGGSIKVYPTEYVSPRRERIEARRTARRERRLGR
jgi:hypothetical protein